MEEIQRHVPSTDFSSPHSSYHDPSSNPTYVDAPKRKTSEKRYATYELNWNSSSAENNSTDDEFVDTEDHNSQVNDYLGESAQVAQRSVQSSQTQPSPTLTHQDHPTSQPSSSSSSPPQRPTSSSASSKKSVNRPITINTSIGELEKHDGDTPQSPFGGITVTTVKVVEILHSPTTDNSDIDSSSRTEERLSHIAKNGSMQRKRSVRPEDSKNLPKIVEQKRKRQHPVSSPPIPVVPSTRVINHNQAALKVRQEPPQRSSIITGPMQNQKKRASIISPLKGKGLNRLSSMKVKQQSTSIPKEMAFIDPRLIAKRSLVRTQSISRSNNVPSKPLKRGTSTLRKRAPPRNMEFASTSNPVHSNDPTDMESDIMPRRTIGLPWLPGSPKPPKLIHASLVPLPNRAQRAASTNPNRTSRIIPTNPDRTSKILSSVNPNRTSRILSTMNPRRNLKSLTAVLPNNNNLARANSLRRRPSVRKRASLDFRRQLLEESIMSSFGGTYNAQPQAHQKPPIRRKTRKGSNAKLEDREVRREKRREKREKKLAEKEQSEVTEQDQGEVIDTRNAVKILEMTRIISTQELVKKVEEENRKKENLNGPLPPPRRSPNEVISAPEYSPPVRSRSNTLSLLSSPPERRPSKPESGLNPLLQSNEPPPFPAHLSPLTEHNRLQFSPQSSSSPPNSSSMAPAPPEESDRPLKNDDDAHSHSPTQQPLPSPKAQKLGRLGGLFNKQTIGSPGTPHTPPLPLSSSSPPTTYMTHPSSLIPTRSAPPPPVLNLPPQSPPLSPSRTQRLQSQLPRLNKGRRTNETDQAAPNPEKLRKMEQFEALIAGSEPSASKKSKPGKISALTSLIMTSTAATSTSSSPNTASSASSIVDKKRATDVLSINGYQQSGEVSNVSGGSSEKRSNGMMSNPNVERLSIERDSIARSSLTSLAVSITESVHYRPEEKDALGKPTTIGEDGVIRVTLTPAVCR